MVGPRFNTQQANFLARAAREGRKVTYGEFAGRFGLANQGCGLVLTEMGERLKLFGLPLLPVIVVNKETGLPSKDATFYARLGLANDDDIMTAQQDCFDYDWSKATFWREEQ